MVNIKCNYWKINSMYYDNNIKAKREWGYCKHGINMNNILLRYIREPLTSRTQFNVRLVSHDNTYRIHMNT